MSRTLIIIEQQQTRAGLDLLDVARQIYGDVPGETYALLINGDQAPLIGRFDTLFSVQDSAIRSYDQLAISGVVTGLHHDYNFDCILMVHTQWSGMLLPRVAAKLNAGLVTDVRGVSYAPDDDQNQNQRPHFIRPAAAHSRMDAIDCNAAGPIMLTVRSGSFHSSDRGGKKTRIVEPKGLAYRTGGLRLIQKQEKLDYDICDSEILISGGGGVARDFEALKPLAQALGGQVSASRSLVDRGLAPKPIQVGQSGKTVSPRLYMALGIHGAMQHVVALKNVDTIISVNTNENAPICSLSDIVVKGDALAFVGKLLKKIKEEQSNGTH
ncbi:electron transfer flavoprotein subunit alpha/FixB family protein [Cohaesibacter celericrescens]|uniref:Electron transfer flavoprotein subunit alpha/FixB family protein n=1 Tax=Cohaesibacter celericrescens TaxID=2067669 RepID=A0A2N5XV00_9HYPH|nr:electron transfer flavoprotein subunit alpha/FixB family protein [Cohaesibacter celericrescens]PLW78300.1 electron transfer flavoprotein subunit alpha/FixB family protein [Cohaesibacter celericrescens]